MPRKHLAAPKRHAPAAPAGTLRRPAWVESPALLCLAAVALALAIYWRATGFEFIDLDDPDYVLTNSRVLGGLTWDSARWALTHMSSTFTYWHPVTWLSLMLDASLYGQKASGYHATSILLHAANVALVFQLVRSLTADKWTAFAVAALFAVHPAHQESVIWITERKDVLFLFWGLLAMLGYLSWARNRSRAALAAFYCCYALSLMSKPVLVVLPGVLLLLDYWPLGRFNPYKLFLGDDTGAPFGRRLRAFWPLLLEKLPMLALAGLSTMMTMLSHPKAYDVVELDDFSRYGNAFLALVRYAWKVVAPTNLAIIYPFPVPLPVWPLVVSVAALCAALCLTLWKGRRFPWLVPGLGVFLLGFLPNVVTPKMGMHVALADRFTYFPFLGAYLIVVLGAREGAARFVTDRRRLHALLALGLLALLGWYWFQANEAIGYWRNKYTIYERAIEVTPGHHILLNNYGKILLDRGDTALAEVYTLRTLALQPNYNLALGNLGNIYMATGRFDQAIDLFKRAIAAAPKDPFNANYHYDMARCFVQIKRFNEAEQHYLQALAIQPNDPEAHNDLGNIALLRGDLRGAEEHYVRAVALEPSYLVAQDNLARVRRTLAGAK